MALGDGGADGEDEEEGDVGGGAPEIDGPTTKPGGKKPGARVGNELETRIDQIELEGFIGRVPGF